MNVAGRMIYFTVYSVPAADRNIAIDIVMLVVVLAALAFVEYREMIRADKKESKK